MDGIIPYLDLLGTIAFILAFYFAHHSYRDTRKTAGYWLIFSIGVMLAFFWGVTVTFEWINVYPAIMDDFQQPLFAGTAIVLSLVARLTYDGLISPTP